MNILGIDPGYGTCGFAVIEKIKSTTTLKDYGVIKTKPQSYFPARLQEIAEDIQSLLDTYKPDIVSIEDLFFAKNVTTGMQVSQVRGIIIYLAHLHGAKIMEPKPVEVKSSFCGNGQATKAEMRKMAQIQFKLEKKPKLDDAADAIAVAFYATQLARVS